MGTSTDGILAFGVNFGDEDDFEETCPSRLAEILQSEDGLEDYIVESSGIGQWSEDFTSEESEGYWSRRVDILKDSPVEEVMHCSSDYPMTILAVPGFVRRANRGYPLDIKPESLVVPQGKIDAFKAWLAQHGVEDEPRWILCSFWG